MKSYIRPIQIGKTTFSKNIFYAPLAGCSDFPFRQMSAKYSPGLMYCEMVKMEPLIRRDKNTLSLLDYAESMRPIGAQLCGSNPKIAAQAAKIIEDLGFDVVDLNCGCPVDKVTKDGSGSGMLKNPHLIGEMLSEIVSAVSIPVTVKIRAGWDEENIIASQVTEIAEQAGAQAITIHGRTREQAYRGLANWDHVKASKQVAKKIKVIGNGDLFDPEAVKKMFDYTGCDGVLIARGTMGQPWIVDDIVRALEREGEAPKIRTLDDSRAALLEHFRYMTDYHEERRVVLEMRKVGCWYFKSEAGVRSFRSAISQASSLDEIGRLIKEYTPADFSGGYHGE